MRVVSLLYHDVVGPEGFAASGFPGGDADIYKLTRDAFTAHLDAVAAVARPAPSIEALLQRTPAGGARGREVVFTFDDGGLSALAHTAPLLEARGWRGHFFITTDRLGTPGFLDGTQVRELHARGHVIGSHSASHPARISALPAARIDAEWRDSVHRLEDLLGAPVHTASVPAGFYSAAVGASALAAGLRVLFTSEPTDRVRHVDGGVVLGRYSVMRDTAPELVRAFAAGATLPRWRQAAYWNAKKVVKAVGGERWLALRRRLLAGR